MRWLHNLLHYRCEREIARLDAILAAAMPRYVPVVTPPGSMSERIERALKQPEEPQEMPGVSSSWPERTVEWKEPV